jgi:hypothetical protein
MIEYLWYVLRLNFRFGGPASVGAVMQMEGYTDCDIHEIERHVAHEEALKLWNLLGEAPRSHIASGFVRDVFGWAAGGKLPARTALLYAQHSVNTNETSCWVRWAMEEIMSLVEGYDLENYSGRN